MGFITGDFGGFAEAEEAFEEIHGALTETLDELDQNLRAGLRQWEGDAVKAYWRAHDEWRAAADDIGARLKWLHRVLTITHGNFGSASDTTTTMWGQ